MAVSVIPSSIERTLDLGRRPIDVARALTRAGPPGLCLGDFREEAPGATEAEEGSWRGLVAVGPRVAAVASLGELDRILEQRRLTGGPAGCGVAVLAAYEWLAPSSVPPRGSMLSGLLVLEVDASIRFESGAAIAVVRPGHARLLDGLEARLECASKANAAQVQPRGASVRTSLPKGRYLEAARAVKEHIRRGDIYQANLTQRFEVAWERDPFDTYVALAAETPAPRAAYVAADGFAVASVSPETFLRIAPQGEIATWPIKGTRRRGATAESDAAAAAELLASGKDRAELTMIVDLERNDLGRVCRGGSVHVPHLARLRSYPAVHHLVAEVRGTLKAEALASDVLAATFPGGSITGAPKIRAMEILRELEPVPRGFYTGSLFWFGDDGAMDSSILIRTAILAGGKAFVGAGGGVVADSDPEAEWRESNDKARALLRVLGTTPEEAQ